MSTQVNSLAVYRELADHYERQKQPAMRDRFLVLAADAAWKAGQHDEAERLRQRLLQANPHHLLKPYSSFAQALEAPDVQTYVRDLHTNYPPELAEGLLRNVRPAAPPAKDKPPPALPVTAPLIDLANEATLPLGATVDQPLKVYQVKDEPEAPARPASQGPARPAARKDIPPKPGPYPTRPATPVPAAPRAAPAARPAPAAPLYAPLPPPPESGAQAGAWLGSVLGGV
ncbi:MAG TPA: hypothetical protein VFE78_30710, partial [Gemmataceae bacterium]|nr:hypothetical protein [Gemmataceae bacterium]